MRQTISRKIQRGVVLPLLAGTMLMPAHALSATVSERRAAVESVVNDASGQCADVNRFYWEIGDANGIIEHGRKGFLAPTKNTKMAIASAGKWLYGAYVVQKRNGQLNTSDVYPLTMRGNYVDWSVCLLSHTVGACQQYNGNDTYTSNPDHEFNYQGSQLQAHAVHQMHLGGDTSGQLRKEMQDYLGSDIDFTFNIPSPAAGMRTNAANYALFLRKLLGGSLLMGNQLSANSTDAGPANIEDGGVSPPYDYFGGEDWDYAPGHWIENDPNAGDGAFSSPGAFGFYPWIDASETYYGVLARHSLSSDAFVTSTQCGRTMRDAWLHPEKYTNP